MSNPGPIDRFVGQYNFLSNFSRHGFWIGGVYWQTNEHWFQAAKAVHFSDALHIRLAAEPWIAKQLGRGVERKEDWDIIRVNVMAAGIAAKFAFGSLCAKQLLGTGCRELIEGNNWHDTFWGVYRGEGSNMLGKLLMLQREKLQDMESKAMEGLFT